MKTKTHQFVVTVKTTGPKSHAHLAVLASFARRNPDGCEFGVIDLAAHRRNQHRRIMRACEESRRAVGAMTDEQREGLHRRAMEIIEKSALRSNAEVSHMAATPNHEK